MAKHMPKASPHRELWAQGIGNMLAALAGGIPITSVIARSSANIDAGAQSRISAMLHGGWLLLSVWLLSHYINMIPLASLAAILIYTGYKLTRVSLYVNMFRKGVEQFVPFVVTIVAIIFSDLLTGVLIGLAISIFFLLRGTYKSQFFLQKTSDSAGVVSATLVLPAQLSFLHKQKIAQLLAEIPDNSRILIDASHCEYIDADVLEMLEHFEKTGAGSRNIRLSIVWREPLQP
jgi:MFS superfamily sulfate permease-like transporter